MTIGLQTPYPAALSRELRLGSDRFLARRRSIVALNLLSGMCMGLVALYQIGLIKHLPNFP